MLHCSLFPSINHKVKPKFAISLLNIHFLNAYSEQTLPLNLHPKNDIKIDMALYDVLVAESILRRNNFFPLWEKAKMSSCCTKTPIIARNFSLRLRKFNWKLYKKLTRS